MRSLVLFFIVGLLCGTALAFTAPFSTGPAATQVYQSDSGQASQPAAPLTTSGLDAASGASLINSAGVETGPAGEVAQLTQSTLAFERDTDHRIQNLNDSNHAMSTALQTIEENMTQLQQQVSMLVAGKSSSVSVAHRHQSHSSFDFAVYLNLIAAGIFLALSGFMFGKLLSRRAPIHITKNINASSDYDFMQTPEAIPAQLDLARSYIAMQDFDQARATLSVVLEKGNMQQRMIAESLIQKMNNKST